MKRLILALLTGAALATSLPAHAAVKTIVLVHGAFADGSGWKPVADILVSHGYSVRVVQEPETSFDADVAATQRVLDKAGGLGSRARPCARRGGALPSLGPASNSAPAAVSRSFFLPHTLPHKLQKTRILWAFLR